MTFQNNELFPCLQMFSWGYQEKGCYFILLYLLSRLSFKEKKGSWEVYVTTHNIPKNTAFCGFVFYSSSVVWFAMLSVWSVYGVHRCASVN